MLINSITNFVNNYTLYNHVRNYSFCGSDWCMLILKSPYAARHQELAIKQPEFAQGHRVISYLHQIPVFSILTALIERIIGYALKRIILASDSKTTLSLLQKYRTCWNPNLNAYQNIPYNELKFKELLKEYNAKIKIPLPREISNKTDAGYIERKDLPAGTQIFFRADLHGDLKSLTENLERAREEGLLDANYRCCKNVQLVFGGDYGDRGNHSLEVISILLTLKMENPDQVTLLRGNHDYSSLNLMYQGTEDSHFISFLKMSSEKINENWDILDKTYSTFPLTLYVAQEGEKREYTQFTHGLFPFYYNPLNFLTGSKDRAYDIVPSSGIKVREIDLVRNFQKATDLDESEVETAADDLKTTDRVKYKKIKVFKAAQDIINLIEEDQDFENSEITPYNWGDVSYKDDSIVWSLANRRWSIAPRVIVSHFLLNQGTNHKIKFFIRGHFHTHVHHVYKNKLRGTTLTVGNDVSPDYATKYNQKDKAYILTIAPKIKDWTKRIYLRAPGAETEPTTPTYPLRFKEN